ncbi:hypothetical protein AURDEDRAFT_162903 [Auricularia subglabra TFB-10046 SS5]|nr:hypothetical protein AURDEDRAFT_162903 [Auricularia subglabra TFB-10046 SS5]
MSNFQCYALDTPLETFRSVEQKHRAPAPGVFHLLFEGIPPNTPPPPRVPTPTVEYCKYGRSTAIMIPGDRRLPTELDVDHVRMWQTPGLIFLNKAQFVSPRFTQPNDKLLPLLRRPRGLGKTTFLSLLEAYVDVMRAPLDILHPEAADYDLPPDLSQLVGKSQLLVLHLDLAELEISSNAPEAELRATCSTFLDAAAAASTRKYEWLLRELGRVDVPNHSFKGLLRMSGSLQTPVFVGVDNYTAPVSLTGHCAVTESIVAEEVFAPILRAFDGGWILRGLAVGDSDLPGPLFWPYGDNDTFSDMTMDLTPDLAALDIVGMTEEDIVALETVLFEETTYSNVDFLHEVRCKAGVPAEVLDHPPSRGRIYSFSDVFALARVILDAPNGLADAPSVRYADASDFLHRLHYPGTQASALRWKTSALPTRGTMLPTNPPHLPT